MDNRRGLLPYCGYAHQELERKMVKYEQRSFRNLLANLICRLELPAPAGIVIHPILFCAKMNSQTPSEIIHIQTYF